MRRTSQAWRGCAIVWRRAQMGAGWVAAPWAAAGSFDATAGYLAARAPGSGVVFDYALPYRLLPWPVRVYMYFRARRLAKIGEPWRTFFEPDELAGVLERAGFASARDIPPQETNARFFAGRTDGLRVSGFAHLMTASL